MPITVSLLTFAMACVLAQFPRATGAAKASDWRGSFLLASAIWGALVVLFSEGLGLVDALNRTWLTVCWSMALILFAGLAWRQGSLWAAWKALPRWRFPLQGAERWLALGLAVIAVALFLVAWVSPPNNVDSQLYHMARVVHWAQNQNLDHYATAYEHQLLKPIWSELAILNLRVLWGNDRPAGLVQWFSMAGSLVGVSAIAALLGASPLAQLVAAAFAISIPMGVLQSTSTQNDYVVGFWVSCLAYWVVLSRKRELTKLEFSALAMSVGVGMLTKGTFYVYAIPFLAWYFWPRVLKPGLKTVVVEGVVLTLFVGALNAGFWARNVGTYGGPFGTSEWLQRNLWIRISPSTSLPEGVGTAGEGVLATAEGDSTPSAGGDSDGIVTKLSKRLTTGLARLAAQNLTFPGDSINAWLRRTSAGFPAAFGEQYDPLFVAGAWNHEDLAGNPLHLLLIPLSLALLVIHRRRAGVATSVFLYASMVLGCYALLPIIIGHSISVWGIRYQLPFFVIWAPIAGLAISGFRARWLGRSAAALLILAAVPWVLLNKTRPIIVPIHASSDPTCDPYCVEIGGVFRQPQVDTLFAGWREIKDDLIFSVDAIKSSSCSNVGLKIDSHEWEYAIWWLLDAPQSGVRIETLLTYPHLESLIDPLFRPCAILCTTCGGSERADGLEKIAQYGFYSVYTGEGYSPDSDD